jgi:hypothetical protein
LWLFFLNNTLHGSLLLPLIIVTVVLNEASDLRAQEKKDFQFAAHEHAHGIFV